LFIVQAPILLTPSHGQSSKPRRAAFDARQIMEKS
jgi:hypothetical protein